MAEQKEDLEHAQLHNKDHEFAKLYLEKLDTLQKIVKPIINHLSKF